jgi:hypothetical protein
MWFLCIPHHLDGVDFKASSIANKHCYVGTLSSKSDKKFSKGFRPSKVGKLLTVVPIQHTYMVNLAHLLVDTLYILFFQFSIDSSKSDEHALSLRQLKFPYAVGLMQSCCLAVNLYMFSSSYARSSTLMGSVYHRLSSGSNGAMNLRPYPSNVIHIFFK